MPQERARELLSEDDKTVLYASKSNYRLSDGEQNSILFLTIRLHHMCRLAHTHSVRIDEQFAANMRARRSPPALLIMSRARCIQTARAPSTLVYPLSHFVVASPSTQKAKKSCVALASRPAALLICAHKQKIWRKRRALKNTTSNNNNKKTVQQTLKKIFAAATAPIHSLSSQTKMSVDDFRAFASDGASLLVVLNDRRSRPREMRKKRARVFGRAAKRIARQLATVPLPT